MLSIVLSVIEGVMGVLYLAVLVAKVVSIHARRAAEAASGKTVDREGNARMLQASDKPRRLAFIPEPHAKIPRTGLPSSVGPMRRWWSPW